MITVLKSKIHRATVTEADLNYEGSITIDEHLMNVAKIREFEQVHVWNISNGSRVVTYAIRGKSGSGVVCMNGAGAHLTKKNDLIIIATFKEVPEDLEWNYQPVVFSVDERNKIKSIV